MFVMTKVLLWEAYFCHDKRCVLSWQTCVCRDRHVFFFVVTKMILVAAPTNDIRLAQWQIKILTAENCQYMMSAPSQTSQVREMMIVKGDICNTQYTSWQSETASLSPPFCVVGTFANVNTTMDTILTSCLENRVKGEMTEWISLLCAHHTGSQFVVYIKCVCLCVSECMFSLDWKEHSDSAATTSRSLFHSGTAVEKHLLAPVSLWDCFGETTFGPSLTLGLLWKNNFWPKFDSGTVVEKQLLAQVWLWDCCGETTFGPSLTLGLLWRNNFWPKFDSGTVVEKQLLAPVVLCEVAEQSEWVVTV